MGAIRRACDPEAMRTHDDDHIRNVRSRLLERGAELRERIQRAHADLARTREPLPRDPGDAAIVMENDDVLRAIEATSASEIHHIRHALDNLDAGSFGSCEGCGRDISADRLEIIPYATRCAACERTT